jgi:hypothetical protein
VKNISISNEAHDRVLFEGVFGELEELNMVEDKVLEIKGTVGTLRIDLTMVELAGLIDRGTECGPSSEVGSYTSTKKKGDE